MALFKDGPIRAGDFDVLAAPIAETRERLRELRARLVHDHYIFRHEYRARGRNDVWLGTAAQIERMTNALSKE